MTEIDLEGLVKALGQNMKILDAKLRLILQRIDTIEEQLEDAKHTLSEIYSLIA